MMKAAAIKDVDFGIHGFVASGERIEVIEVDEIVTIDLVGNKYKHPRSEAIQELSKLEFMRLFKVVRE